MAVTISVCVLAAIALLEIICLLKKSGTETEYMPVIAVIPIFPEDSKLDMRLNCMSEKITYGSCRADIILLIDYGASADQLASCMRFCAENPCSEIIDYNETEKMLSKTFAIEKEI